MKPAILSLRFPRASGVCAVLLGCVYATFAGRCMALNRTSAHDQGWHRAHQHGPPWAGPVASSQTLHVGGAEIQVDFGPGPLDLDHNYVMQWIETAARAVSVYYGRFPVPRERVLVLPIADDRGVLTGTTWGNVDGFPAFARMRLGQHTTEQDLENDWTMTHEFVHTALPSLSPDHHWLEEGLAVYIEPIARVQLGTLTPRFIWGEMFWDMSKGEPAPGDQGLDATHTWASTYWGGALFCLVADVTIREKTKNRKGLQDAVRGVLAAGGSIAQDWPISKVFAVGDQATGTTVLTDLYKKMGETAYAPVDLDRLWQQLGVRSEDGKIVFNNHAPLARIREKITSTDVASARN
ncbi:MAG: hypothetical protein WA708_09160 [Acidobacteriaceae bacterium]